MNRNNLYLEYARVIEMCKGTSLEDSPWECVKDVNGPILTPPYFNADSYEFAVAVLEYKPVFVGDTLYSKHDGEKYTITDPDITSGLIDRLCWEYKLPIPKRTFLINQQELTCPLNTINVNFSQTFSISTSSGTNNFYFNSCEEMREVKDHIVSILNEAKNKER